VRVRITVGACLLAALSLGVAACGSDDKSDTGGGSSTGSASAGSTALTIYASNPLQGVSRPLATSVVNGEKLALSEVGGKVGNFKIKFVSLDDSTAAAGKWDPGATSAAARKAAQDKSTIAYLGEFNSGASAVSIPILNGVPILQVSATATYVGLTRAEGAEKGEPDKYYPAGKRTFGRVVPADHIQAAAQATYQKDKGCTKVYILNDQEVFGKGLADQAATIAKNLGLTVLANQGMDPKAANYRAVAGKVKSAGADCVFFGGLTASHALQLWHDLHAAVPTAMLFGPDGMAETAFTTKLTASEQKMTYLTNPTLDPKLYPAAGQKFFTDYQKTYGIKPEVYAIYGYEAMKVVLQAIQNAGDKGNDRQAVIDAFFQIKDRESVLGTYSIDENGDTTLSAYGGNKVEGGQLVFDKVIKPQTGA
jgi:branched-chain amino acid transport system substrate-binding protein